MRRCSEPGSASVGTSVTGDGSVPTGVVPALTWQFPQMVQRHLQCQCSREARPVQGARRAGHSPAGTQSDMNLASLLPERFDLHDLAPLIPEVLHEPPVVPDVVQVHLPPQTMGPRWCVAERQEVGASPPPPELATDLLLRGAEFMHTQHPDRFGARPLQLKMVTPVVDPRDGDAADRTICARLSKSHQSRGKAPVPGHGYSSVRGVCLCRVGSAGVHLARRRQRAGCTLAAPARPHQGWGSKSLRNTP